MDSLESQLKGLVKTIEAVMRARTDVASATGEFAQTLYDLGASDLGESLSHSLNGLAVVESKAQEFLRIQTEQDMVTLMSTGKRNIYPYATLITELAHPTWYSADEYARLVNSVRVSFTSSSMGDLPDLSLPRWRSHRVSAPITPGKIATQMCGERSKPTKRAGPKDEPAVIH